MSSAVLSGDFFIIQIPAPGTPLFDLRVSLSGIDYILKFDWSGRESRWYMTIFDAAGNVLTAGIKLVSGWLLYNRETNPLAPFGNFMVIDPEDQAPQLADFGIRSQLVWMPAA